MSPVTFEPLVETEDFSKSQAVTYIYTVRVTLLIDTTLLPLCHTVNTGEAVL